LQVRKFSVYLFYDNSTVLQKYTFVTIAPRILMDTVKTHLSEI